LRRDGAKKKEEEKKKEEKEKKVTPIVSLVFVPSFADTEDIGES
jgi:hypothetical protein